MKFKFSLEKVLKQRNIQMDLARKDYLDAQNFLLEEQQKLEDLKKQREEAFLHRNDSLLQGHKDWKHQAEQFNLFITGQDLRIAQQNERLKKIEKVVESRREILRQALTEVKMIEKIKEKKKNEFWQKVNETESKELDEMSTIRYVRNTKNE